MVITRKCLYGVSIILAVFICGSSFNITEAYSNAQKKVMAMRAARIDAIRNLTETIYGTSVDSETDVEDMVVNSDKIKARLAAIIKGATEISHQFNDDGSTEVTMKIELGRVTDVLGTTVEFDGKAFTATGLGVPPRNKVKESTGQDSDSSGNSPEQKSRPTGAIGP